MRDRYSITWSARASRAGGTARPSALAISRLMTSSNLFGCSTGISAGFVGFTSGSPQLLREVNMNQGQSIRDASHLYKVERRVQHAARPARIMEMQLSPTHNVPWNSHTNITDNFYVSGGPMRLFLQDPKEEVNLKPDEIHVVRQRDLIR
jgi:hypothetical protein